jgi:hypothetical protein
MDVRDLMFWYREARKKAIRDQMSAIYACRLSMAKDNAYQEAMLELQKQINVLEFGENKVVAESWNELKKIGRG